MRKVLGNILIATAVGSVLLVGNAFGEGRMASLEKSRTGEQIRHMNTNVWNCQYVNHGKSFMNTDHKKSSTNKQGSRFAAMDNNQHNLTDGNGRGNPGSGNGYAYNNSETPPVPEPATMLLVGTGLVGLVGVARRNAKKK